MKYNSYLISRTKLEQNDIIHVACMQIGYKNFLCRMIKKTRTKLCMIASIKLIFILLKGIV